MKNFYLNNMRNVLLVTAFLLTISVIINSCRKDAKLSDIANNDKVTKMDITEYKLLFNQAVTAYKKLSSNDYPVDLIHSSNVDWDNNIFYNRPDSSLIAEFRMKNDSTFLKYKPIGAPDTAKFANKTDVVFIKYQNGKRLNFYMKVVEEIDKHTNKSIINDVHYTVIPANFNGIVYFISLEHQFLNGYQYKNGIISGTVSLNKIIQSQTQILSTEKKKVLLVQVCSTYQTIETTCSEGFYQDSNGNWQSSGAHDCYDTVVGTTEVCYSTDTGNGGVSGDSGGGGGSTPTPTNPCVVSNANVTIIAVNSVKVMYVNPNDGGGTGNNPPCTTTQKITNNVKNPCLHDMVDAAVYRDINYNLKNSMVSIFGYSQTTFNLSFTDGAFYYDDGSINYTTQGNTHSKVYKENSNGRYIIVAMDAEIKLNSNTLPGASQEFIAAIILHEALHAYFAESGSIDDHNVMVRDYIPWFESALHSMYPSIIPGDIEALAYSGLTDNQAFGTDPVNTSLRAYYNGIQNSYLHGQSGTPCN